MENNGTTPLNTHDSWESVVNANASQRSIARERVAANRRERKRRKLLASVWVFAVPALAFLIFGITGYIAGWLSVIGSITCLLAACFQLGRCLEAMGK